MNGWNAKAESKGRGVFEDKGEMCVNEVCTIRDYVSRGFSVQENGISL